jgi:predicted NBD/HSP70 family sugar kinase
MSMPRAVRHINEARLITALLRKGPQSRPDLARMLGLTRSTTGNLISGLEALGFVTTKEIGADHDRTDMARDVGRPGALFALRGMHSYFLGMELGVGYLRAALMDLTGAIVARRFDAWMSDSDHCHGPSPDPDWLAGRIAAMARQILNEVETDGPDMAAERLRGLCISVPGLVTADGVILRAPKLGWSNVPFVSLLRDHMPDVPAIAIENDANAFALSQIGALRAQGIRDALFFWIEAGVGGAVMCNGMLIRGAHGFAGEFGHLLTIGPQDTILPLEEPARMEHVVGLDGVLSGQPDITRRAGAGRMMTVDGLLARVAQGDADAVSRLRLWAKALASTIATLSSALDPKAVYLGGPGTCLFSVARDDVLDQMRHLQLAGSPLPEIVVSDLGQDAPSLGCAMMLHEHFLAIDQTLVFGNQAE